MSVIRKKINSGTWYFITHCLSHPNMNTTALRSHFTCVHVFFALRSCKSFKGRTVYSPNA